jgi:predicted metal-dependent enzyme (double-stranded beta helix superfamily)
MGFEVTSMLTLFGDFIERIRFDYSARIPARAELEVIGNELKAICSKFAFDENVYRLAHSGEELMYELCVDPNGGASIYLVSDGAGVDTVPHEHQTWAVIVGISGAEFNVFYKPSDEDRVAIRIGERCIREGNVLAMEAHEIHAIDSSLGIHPTYHVHLYGRSLASLPSFNSRCYTDGRGNTIE